jgi:hypothetical protein
MSEPVFWLVLAALSFGIGFYALIVGFHNFGGRDILSWFPLAAATGFGYLAASCVRRAIDLTRRDF